MKVQPLSPPLGLQTYPFQRSSSRFRLRRVNKKARLTFRHILIFFILAGTLSYLTSQLFLYLIAWDGLRIQHIQVKTQKLEVEREILNSLSDLYFQNILKLDLGLVEKRTLAHPWVKRAKIRKIFPSSLEIILEERQPLAVFHQDSQIYLIDEEGIKLKALPHEMETETNLPLIYLADQKVNLFKEDWQLINECLQALNPEEKASARIFFSTPPVNLRLQLGNDPVRLILGKEHFQEKINLFRNYRTLLEAGFGPLDYIDLRFWEDRIYFKPREAGHFREIKATEEEN